MKKILSVAIVALLSSLSACSSQVMPNTAAASSQQGSLAPVQAVQQVQLNPNVYAQNPAAEIAAPHPLQPDSQLSSQPDSQPGTTAEGLLIRKTPDFPLKAVKPAPVKSSARPAATKPASAAPKPAAQAPAVAQVSAEKELLAKALERFNSLESFKITVEGFESNNTKGPTNLTFTMSALHGRAKIEVLKHTNSLYVGVKMGYQTGQETISVRPGGALGFVKLDTKLSDERLSTPRGYRLDQIDAFAIAKRLIAGPVQPKVLGKAQINGRNLAILEYTQANDFDSKITRELLGIDLEDHFMRVHEMYEGSKLVMSLKLSNVQLNAPLSAKDLEI